MTKIFCSTGALIGRPNNRDYRLLERFAPELDCDGFEFMVYSSWYPGLDRLIDTIKSYKLNIPVIHCEKSLSEKLAGGVVTYDSGEYIYRELTPEEDSANLKKAG